MKGTRVAPRYAKSLLNLAIEQKVVDQAYADMLRITEVCKMNRDFIVFLRSPIVKADKKQKVISTVFSSSLSPITEGFIRIITTHRRENILPEIANSFVLQYKIWKNIATAEVITAVKLDDEAKKRIISMIRKTDSRDVEIKETINPDIIGGLIVRVGDKQFDGSIIRKIKELKKGFSKNAFVSQI